MPAKGHIDALGVDFVHPHHAGLEPVSDGYGGLCVAAPDRTTQAVDAGVGAFHDVVDIVIGDDWADQIELLILDDHAILGGMVDDGDRQEVAGLRVVDVAAENDRLHVRLDVGEEAFELVELHLVLHRPDTDCGIQAIAYFHGPGVGDELLHEVRM